MFDELSQFSVTLFINVVNCLQCTIHLVLRNVSEFEYISLVWSNVFLFYATSSVLTHLAVATAAGGVL